MNRSWAPNYLARWLFAQQRVWITAAGEQIVVTKMDPGHAFNTLLMLERVADNLRTERALPTGYELQETPLYKALYKRVSKALS